MLRGAGTMPDAGMCCLHCSDCKRDSIYGRTLSTSRVHSSVCNHMKLRIRRGDPVSPPLHVEHLYSSFGRELSLQALKGFRKISVV